MAKSLAFWLKNPRKNIKNQGQDAADGQKSNPDEGSSNKIELHFNYWSLKSGKVNFLDIGVRLSAVSGFDSIKFYLPFSPADFDYIPTLGKRICDDSEMVSAIFNSPAGNFNHEPGYSDFSLKKKGDESEIRFFNYIEANNRNPLQGVDFKEIGVDTNKGTIITFPENLFTFEDDKDGYFRFRLILKEKAKETISQLYDPPDSNITTHFETIEMVDFRLNEVRNLPLDIRRELDGEVFVHSVHFFLIREASSEFRMSHSEYSRCRVLEKDLWDKYLKEECYGNGSSQMLIYHWKKTNKEIDDFSAFAKFTRRHVKSSDLKRVVAYAIFFGVVASMLANILWGVGAKVLGPVFASSDDEKNVQSPVCTLDSSIEEKMNILIVAADKQEAMSRLGTNRSERSEDRALGGFLRSGKSMDQTEEGGNDNDE